MAFLVLGDSRRTVKEQRRLSITRRMVKIPLVSGCTGLDLHGSREARLHWRFGHGLWEGTGYAMRVGRNCPGRHAMGRCW